MLGLPQDKVPATRNMLTSSASFGCRARSGPSGLIPPQSEGIGAWGCFGRKSEAADTADRGAGKGLR